MLALNTNNTAIYANSMLSPSLLNLDWLAQQPNLAFLLKFLPAQLLYLSLMANELENSLEILHWLRGAQLQKVLDFAIWEKSNEFGVDDISTAKALNWISAWLAIDPEFAAERFLELEEETICLILSKIFEILPDGIAHITSEIRDTWWQTPDKRFFLKIRLDEDIAFEILYPFIHGLYAYDIKLAGSLFAYACMLIRQETLDQALSWREKRLAEQGIVSLEEAIKILRPKKNIKAEIQVSKSYKTIYETGEEFHEIVKLLSSLEPEQGVKLIHNSLGSARVKSLVGADNIPAIQVYEDEDFLTESAENILRISKEIAIAIEFSANAHSFTGLLIERLIQHIALHNPEQFLQIKETLAYLTNCIVSILSGIFSQKDILKSILITRGAINIGLELCLQNPQAYAIKLLQGDELLEQALECFKTVGMKFLFHVGWNKLFELAQALGHKLEQLDITHSQYAGKLHTVQKIKLSDSSFIDLSLTKMLANLRFNELQNWLCSCENLFSNELFFTIKALFTKVPLYPKTLDTNRATNTVSQETKVFENIGEVNRVFEFINNFEHNLTHIY